MRKYIYAMLLVMFTGMLMSFMPAQDAGGDRLLGVWEPGSGKARVKVEKIGAKYYGKIVWLREPIDPATGQPKLDKKNPDKNLQTAPLKGIRLLRDFNYKGGDKWADGTIYDPENGKTYSCNIKMTNINTLDIRGYIGVSAIGRTDVWKRVEASK